MGVGSNPGRFKLIDSQDENKVANTHNNIKAILSELRKDHPEVFKRLTTEHIEPPSGETQWFGKTLLHYAAEKSTPDVVELFLECDPKAVNVRDYLGNTPLMYAAKNKGAEVIKRLLAANADVNMQNDEGRTALMWAVFSGAVDVIKTLFGCEKSGGAIDVNVVNRKSDNAHLVAVASGNIEAAIALKKKGAATNITNLERKNAFMVAATNTKLTPDLRALLDIRYADLIQTDRDGRDIATCIDEDTTLVGKGEVKSYKCPFCVTSRRA